MAMCIKEILYQIATKARDIALRST